MLLSESQVSLNSYLEANNGKMAMKYLKEAALNGSEEAQYDYAIKLLEANNLVEAVAWLLEASSIGYSDADRALYDLYMTGTSDGNLKPKYDKAIFYAERLKEAGYENVDILIDEAKRRAKESGDVGDVNRI